MELIPHSASISDVLTRLVHLFDEQVHPARPPQEGSLAWLDAHDRKGDVSERLARQPFEQAMLTCIGIAEVTRSLAALFKSADTAGLSLGHLPVIRSTMEGVGQLSWLINGTRIGSLPDARPEGSYERFVRAALLWATCLQQAKSDLRGQGLDEYADNAATLLDLWRIETTTYLGGVTGGSDGYKWKLDGVKVPSLADQADRGMDFAYFPAAPLRTYGWLSAIGHHRMYPLQRMLDDGGASHFDCRPAQPPLEVTAAGLAAARGVLAAFELLSAYVGWPLDTFAGLSLPLFGLTNFVSDSTPPLL